MLNSSQNIRLELDIRWCQSSNKTYQIHRGIVYEEQGQQPELEQSNKELEHFDWIFVEWVEIQKLQHKGTPFERDVHNWHRYKMKEISDSSSKAQF